MAEADHDEISKSNATLHESLQVEMNPMTKSSMANSKEHLLSGYKGEEDDDDDDDSPSSSGKRRRSSRKKTLSKDDTLRTKQKAELEYMQKKTSLLNGNTAAVSPKRLRRRICCGVCVTILLIIIGLGVGIGVYANNLYKNASAPRITMYDSNFNVIATFTQFGFSGTSTFAIQNNNKVAISLSDTTLPILYPTTNANGDQTEIGTCTITGITVPSGSTLNDTMATNATNIPAATQSTMIVDFLSNQNIKFKVIGTIVGQATVLTFAKVHVPVGVDCTITVQQNPLGSTTTDCSYSTGSVTVGLN
jgi:hypothetical protein